MKIKMLLLFFCSIYITGCGNITTIQESSYANEDMSQETSFEQNNLEKAESKEEISINTIEEGEQNIINVVGKENFNQQLNELKVEIHQAENTNGEITFNKIPWGTNFFSANEMMKEIDGFIDMGLQTIPITINSILGYDDRFPSEYYDLNNIGGIAWSTLDHMNVAGHEVDQCRLVFASVLKEDNYILTEEDSSLYGAYYVFKTYSDEKKINEDLLSKLTIVYGEPNKIIRYQLFPDNDYTEEYIYWYGINDTVLMLHDNQISYIWLGGEELLNNAIQSVICAQQSSENDVYGNGDTSGL